MPRPDRNHPAIREHDLQLVDMIGSRAINRRVRAAGIVGNHPAQGRARTGRHIGPEAKSLRAEEFIELIQHDARPNPYGAPCEVKFGNLAVVARKVDRYFLGQTAP